MKKFTYKNLIDILKTKSVLMVAGSLLLVSCGTQMGGYTETDGVYYDPNKDTIPEGVITNEINRVGNDYVYEDYQTPNDYNDVLNSDWGLYSGTDYNYYNDSWNYPYGFGYSPWGWNSGFGIGLSWGSPWGGFGYNPYWDFGFNPYYGFGYGSYWGYYGYNPYFGYNPYYGYGYTSPFRYKRSGADGRIGNSFGPSGLNRQGTSSRFRSQETLRNSNSVTPGFRNPQSSGFRNQQNGNISPRFNTPGSVNPNTTPRESTPRYRAPQRTPSYDATPRSNDNGGFRSGSDRSGGSFNNSSSGGRSSSSSSGTRSGGFR